jgi:hypothetical protein
MVEGQEWRGEFFWDLNKIIVVEAFIPAEAAIVLVCWSASVGMHYAHTFGLGYARE